MSSMAATAHSISTSSFYHGLPRGWQPRRTLCCLDFLSVRPFTQNTPRLACSLRKNTFTTCSSSQRAAAAAVSPSSTAALDNYNFCFVLFAKRAGFCNRLRKGQAPTYQTSSSGVTTSASRHRYKQHARLAQNRRRCYNFLVPALMRVYICASGC